MQLFAVPTRKHHDVLEALNGFGREWHIIEETGAFWRYLDPALSPATAPADAPRIWAWDHSWEDWGDGLPGKFELRVCTGPDQEHVSGSLRNAHVTLRNSADFIAGRLTRVAQQMEAEHHPFVWTTSDRQES